MADSPERTPEVEEHTPLLPTSTWHNEIPLSRPPPPPLTSRPPQPPQHHHHHSRTRSETPQTATLTPERKLAPGRRHHQRTRSLEEWANMFGIPGISGGEDDVTHERTDNQLSYQERRKRRQHQQPNTISSSTAATVTTTIPSRPPLPPKGYVLLFELDFPLDLPFALQLTIDLSFPDHHHCDKLLGAPLVVLLPNTENPQI